LASCVGGVHIGTSLQKQQGNHDTTCVCSQMQQRVAVVVWRVYIQVWRSAGQQYLFGFIVRLEPGRNEWPNHHAADIACVRRAKQLAQHVGALHTCRWAAPHRSHRRRRAPAAGRLAPVANGRDNVPHATRRHADPAANRLEQLHVLLQLQRCPCRNVASASVEDGRRRQGLVDAEASSRGCGR